MKILYLIDSLRPGGKERQAVALVRGLVAMGIAVRVVSMGEDKFFARDLELAAIGVDYVLRRRRLDSSPFRELLRVVAEFEPDVVHTTCWMTSFFATPVCRARGIPLVNASIQNAFSSGGLKWRLERILMRWSDARIANSLAGLRSRGFSVADPRNIVIHNGFEAERLAEPDPGVVAELNGIARGRRLVGMVAQFKKDKDYSTYLAAAQRLLKRRDDVAFLSVGDGTELEELKKQFHGDSESLHFLGRRADVDSIVSCMYLGVLATFTEGIPNAVMEFMAFGKPVVVTDGGGTSELVEDGVTGWLVPPRDIDALEQRIGHCLDNPQEAFCFGERARARVRAHFSLDALVSKTAGVYRDVVLAGKASIRG